MNTAYAVIQVAGLGCHNGDAEASGGAHVVQVFGGEVPPSLGSEWLAERPVLGQVVMEAYRLAVGAGLEAANNFECDEVLEALENSKEKDMAELVDTLQRFRTEWFMGLETSAGYVEARLFGPRRVLCVEPSHLVGWLVRWLWLVFFAAAACCLVSQLGTCHG